MTSQASFLQITGWALLHSLWQMALLWVFYQLVTGLLKAKASSKASLASALLIGGVGWFIYTFISLYSNDGSAGNSLFIPAFASGNDAAGNLLQQFVTASAVLYLALLLLPVSHFIKNYRYVSVIRKYGLTKPAAEWRIFVKKVSEQMGIGKPVHIWISEFVSSPVTVGFLKPVILVPLAAMNNLSTLQMESVLLHELSHIKRHDYFINLIISVIRTVLYFNPFVKALASSVDREREKHCDEMVLQFQYNSYEYASALLALERASHEFKIMTLAASGNNYDLLQRIELITGKGGKKFFSFRKIVTALATLLFVFTVNGFLVVDKSTNHPALPSFTKTEITEPVSETVSSITSPGVPQKDKTSRTEETYKEEYAISEDFFAVLSPAINSALRPATALEPAEVPELETLQEEQVKEAMETSKRVIESIEWKAVENQVAEVLTEKEKDDLRALYKKEFEKYNWEKWSDKIRVAYDKVDWDRVSEQLAAAIGAIKADSLQKAYNEALFKIAETRKEISTTLKDYSDSLKIVELDAMKLELQRSLEKLKSVKAKKIIHL